MNAGARERNRPVELLEESLQILRSGGAAVLLPYWTGSIPFAVALLALLHDTNLSWGSRLLVRDSFFCAAAFLWLSYWKSRASAEIFARLSSEAEVAAGWVQRAAVQSIFQTFKLLVMPFAMLSLLGWPVASAFFRTLALEPGGGTWPVRSGLRRAFASAGERYVENVVAFLTLAALTVVVWLNVLVAMVLIPALWKLVTGYETDWSRMQTASIFGMFAIASVATWLLVDPWIQTFCLLRVFYQNARRDGGDLLRDISRLAAAGLMCLAILSGPAKASQESAQETMRHGISHAAQSEDYGWLRPQQDGSQSGFLADAAQKMKDGWDYASKRIAGWYKAFQYWLRDLLRDSQSPQDDKDSSPPRTQELRWILAIIAVMICGGIIALFLGGRKAKTAGVSDAAAGRTNADVLNEQILPSDISQEEWLRLALEYLANNQTRLAARAFYLANLSYLGRQSLLSLSLSKSNELYERELARRPNSTDLSSAFVASNRLYERAWFGMRELGADQMDTLRGAVEQLRHA